MARVFYVDAAGIVRVVEQLEDHFSQDTNLPVQNDEAARLQDGAVARPQRRPACFWKALHVRLALIWTCAAAKLSNYWDENHVPQSAGLPVQNREVARIQGGAAAQPQRKPSYFWGALHVGLALIWAYGAAKLSSYLGPAITFVNAGVAVVSYGFICYGCYFFAKRREKFHHRMAFWVSSCAVPTSIFWFWIFFVITVLVCFFAYGGTQGFLTLVGLEVGPILGYSILAVLAVGVMVSTLICGHYEKEFAFQRRPMLLSGSTIVGFLCMAALCLGFFNFLFSSGGGGLGLRSGPRHSNLRGPIPTAWASGSGYSHSPGKPISTVRGPGRSGGAHRGR